MNCAGYRIVQEPLAPTAFDGEGARRYGGRWNSPGRGVVYTAESRALAALEILVHLASSRILREAYRVIPVQFPEELALRVEDKFGLPKDWLEQPAAASTRRLGDEWFARRLSCVLSVPSAVLTRERNFLLNPLHPDFKLVKIGQPERFGFDARLTR